METKKTTVTLLSSTQHPLETVYVEWLQSRTEGPVPLPEEVAGEIAYERLNRSEEVNGGVGETELEPGPREREVLDVFKQVVQMRMPVGETIDFVFMLEHAPIILREQLVRHRIGHSFGGRTGADIIPDLAGKSTFWSQTTRIIDMGDFATRGEYYEPVWLQDYGNLPINSVSNRSPMEHMTDLMQQLLDNLGAMMPLAIKEECQRVVKEAKALSNDKKDLRTFYHQQMRWAQAAYRRLVKAGMPLEDARCVLPVALQHRLTWKTNFSALMHVLSRRTCWLAQLGVWEPVITGIIDELSSRVHPIFRTLVLPPCFGENGEFRQCAFTRENDEIMDKGEYPPCSLFLNRQLLLDGQAERTVVAERAKRYERMVGKFTALWGRDARTGQKVRLK